MSYRLVVHRKDGDISNHYYNDYDQMDYEATLLQFSTNIKKVIAQQETFLSWETLFTITSTKDEVDRSYCSKNCIGYRETGKCFADGACSEYKKYMDRLKRS